MEVVEKNLQQESINLVANAAKVGMDYEKYRDLVHHLAQNNQTTGPEQLEMLVNYTQLNDRRMARWDKTLKFPEEAEQMIKSIDSKITFLVLVESWCGDAAPSLPVMNKIAQLNPNIELKIVLRDKNLELMDLFLTNGARSIPKLIVLSEEDHKVIGEWGPRPSVAKHMAEAYKQEHGKLDAQFKQDLQLWYNKDKGQTILKDLLELFFG